MTTTTFNIFFNTESKRIVNDGSNIVIDGKRFIMKNVMQTFGASLCSDEEIREVMADGIVIPESVWEQKLQNILQRDARLELKTLTREETNELIELMQQDKDLPF
ncbi:hypothetical protein SARAHDANIELLE_68 [Hafnia phage vB_HpaM_SarahDanielle]|uniref:Uncharacterized protein n=1 Tax=Hafnia phage vB_HpaM_SarahDanielle TaxID=2836113 RepID=A0AAE8BBV3_9CAUD|nr:hypothetical protein SARAHDANIELLE_68 [Hafnia phage vB_HpaM_SarahDanielle]